MENELLNGNKTSLLSNYKPYIIYVGKRIVYAILTLIAVITITFIMMKLVPGSPFSSESKMSAAARLNLENYYGLNKPLIVQYFGYLKSVATWNFGPSMISDTLSPNYYISHNLPVTMQLGMQAIIVALIGGLTLGIISALYHNKLFDYIAVVVAIIGVSVPSFIMARILTTYFSQKWGLLPVAKWDSFKYTILPTITLAALPMAQITRLMRSSMLEVLGMDYIKTAKAKGLTRFAVIVKHAIRNAILPVVSMMGTTVANLLTGSFVVEKIYAVPGMGDALIKSIQGRDYPVIMAATVVYCIALIVMVLIVDLIYPLIDPRIDLVSGGASNGK